MAALAVFKPRKYNWKFQHLRHIRKSTNMIINITYQQSIIRPRFVYHHTKPTLYKYAKFMILLHIKLEFVF